MGGGISVESEAGRGSVFLFWVEARRTIPVLESPEQRSELARTGSLHILLAEDNPVNQKVAVALLAGAAIAWRWSCNGQLAVERSKAEAFDLILMDLQMPEMDGWEATRQIRRAIVRRAWQVPIVALTAHAMGQAQQDCLAAGMDAAIVKPFDPAQFYEAIERMAIAVAGAVLDQLAYTG